MRVSALKNDPGFTPFVQYCEVLIDGKKRHDIATADEEKRYIAYFKRDSDGNIEMLGNGKPRFFEDYNVNVEILIKPFGLLQLRPNFTRTADWLASCGKEPGNPYHLSVQVGVHIEEMAEFLDQLVFGPEDRSAAVERDAALDALQHLGVRYKKQGLQAVFKNQAEALDALCDAEVTGNGVAFLAGWSKVFADWAVLDANDAKLVDGKPVILEGGKIGKPEGWQPADLTPFVSPSTTPPAE